MHDSYYECDRVGTPNSSRQIQYRSSALVHACTCMTLEAGDVHESPAMIMRVASAIICRR